jgi:hypothetical protein
LAVLSNIYALVVTAVYKVVVTRRLPTEELTVLTVFNAGYAIALTPQLTGCSKLSDETNSISLLY